IPEMNATLGTVLRKILARIPATSGATFLIRKDTIEITTGQFAAAEKTVRAYPVADLVTPIPNSVNLSSVQQQGSILGGLGQLGGVGGLGALGGVGGLGALGALGALGGGLGALGALGGGLGALGALGGGLGALGGALGGAAGAAGGGFNQLGAQGGF